MDGACKVRRHSAMSRAPTATATRTLDFYRHGSGKPTTRACTSTARGSRANVDYDRFIHRLGHDPVGGPADANGFPPLGGFYNPAELRNPIRATRCAAKT